MSPISERCCSLKKRSRNTIGSSVADHTVKSIWITFSSMRWANDGSHATCRTDSRESWNRMVFAVFAFTICATRMSSTRQKINLCKSRNPKLSRNSDSPEFLLLCTTSYSNLIDARRKKPVMIWYFPVAMLPTFFLTSLHLYEVCNNIVKHRVVKVFPREYTIAYFC